MLCTFTDKENLDVTLDFIKEVYDVVFNYIFVLQDKHNLNQLFITYNVNSTENYKHPDLNTILVHRKKQTNTLYTINALNEVVRSEIGVLDPSYKINWEEYQNCIMLHDSDGLKKIPTKVYKIYKA